MNDIFERIKNKKFEELTKEEKFEIEKFAVENQNFLRLWKFLCNEKRCIWCKKEFPKGIIDPHPKKILPLLSFFRPDFLVHIHTTHGYTQDILLIMCEEISL